MKRLFFFACLLGASVASAENFFPLKVKPTLLSPEDGPDFVAAARLSAQYEWHWTAGDRPDREIFADYDFKSTLSSAPKHNDEPTTLDVRAGFHLPLDAPKQTTLNVRNRNRNEEVGPPTSAGESEFLLGALSPTLAAAFEGDETMRNTQTAIGATLNYTPSPRRDGKLFWWMPYAWVDYRQIHEMGSEVSKKLGVSRQDYWRFGSEVYWQVALANWLGSGAVGGGDLKLIPGLRYYRSTDRNLGLNGGDLADAYYYSFAIDYDLLPTTKLGKSLRGVRLQVAHGRLPPSTLNQTTVSLSVDIDWAELIR